MSRESKEPIVALASPQKSALPKEPPEQAILPSPIKAAIQKRLPNPILFEKYIKRFLIFDGELGIKTFSAIS